MSTELRGGPQAWQHAMRSSFDNFLDVYDAEHVNTAALGRPPLILALANTDPVARVAIAQRLLDDGAEVGAGYPLHVLLGQTHHDPQAETPLLARLIGAGADVNERGADGRTPLEECAAKFAVSDDDLRPFYDVLLSDADLDLLGPGAGGRPVLVNLRKWYAKRAVLVDRAEALLTERGITLPAPH